MNPEPQGWDRRLKLDKGFWVTYAIVGPMTGIVAWPVLSELPLYSQIAGCLLLPFLAAVIVYAIWDVIHFVFIKREINKRQIRAIVLTLIFLGVTFAVYVFIWGINPSAVYLGFFMAFWATIIYRELTRRRQKDISS